MRRRGEAWRWQQEREISTIASVLRTPAKRGRRENEGGIREREPAQRRIFHLPDLNVGLKGPPGNVKCEPLPNIIKYLVILKERRSHLTIFLHFARRKIFNFGLELFHGLTFLASTGM